MQGTAQEMRRKQAENTGGNTDLEERSNCLPVELDHLEVGETVDTSHVDAHDGKHEPQSSQHFTKRDDEHAQWDQGGCHQQDQVRFRSASTTRNKKLAKHI